MLYSQRRFAFFLCPEDFDQLQGKKPEGPPFVDVPPEIYIYVSLICVAMYHLLPKLSLTPALRSP